MGPTLPNSLPQTSHNVLAFKERAEQLAKALRLTGEDEERAGAVAAGAGQLLMCFQRDIAERFEYLQAQLANNLDHLRTGTGSI
jgi:hypothetical protein